MAIVATKLNPAAAPFPGPYALAPLHHLAPPVPPPFPLADAACPPNFPFVTYCCVPSAPAGHIGFCFPAGHHPPSSPPAFCKGGAVPAAAVHGRPPHKLMAAFYGLGGGAGKRQSGKPWKAPAPAAAAGAPVLVPAPPRKQRAARRKAERSMLPRAPKPKPRAPKPRKAAGPRARRAQREGTPPPQPVFTTPRARWWKKLPEPELGWNSHTVMLRNIPNKLRSGDMIQMLDEHCKFMNEAAGEIVSAYDVLYLPMDFRRGCNFGYAFINFTTTLASRMLYHNLQGCGWTVYGSKKVIKIVPARFQGHEVLVRHLQRQRLECDDDEFRPAVFSPPRDGVSAGPIAVRRLGRVSRRPTACAAAAAPAAAPKATYCAVARAAAAATEQ
ncbi:unnamed protein product [Urochloa decumbens]|uniref:Mei2-like C-terminal RNA recognition motif domain-containing protein n=1 Tax=Urochloa decumbens TaxID=240449 RepID=A0ABC9A3H8_9POAL